MTRLALILNAAVARKAQWPLFALRASAVQLLRVTCNSCFALRTGAYFPYIAPLLISAKSGDWSPPLSTREKEKKELYLKF